ncbi:hypothetical protein G9A89_022623 [Geosiphon pyriformis]|nr:hypothetical protein G9A89_022623 [Geosiphon pyriformis]
MATPPRKPFKPQPPRTLARLHRTSNLGYPDYYPPQPGQEEDSMSESNVRQGFIYTQLLPDELATRHDTVHANLQGGRALQNMGDFMLDLLKRKRYEDESDVEDFQPVNPKRFWTDEGLTQEWYKKSDTADLYDLIKDGTPYLKRGDSLLENLCKRRPTYIRALDLIKLAAQIEVVNQGQANQDWTVTCFEFLKFQIRLLEPDEWRYCVQLARFQYEEGLIDQRFLKLTLDHLQTLSDHSYIAIWLYLVLEFLSIYTGSGTLMRLLIDYLLKKIKDIQISNLPIPPSHDGNRASTLAATTGNAQTSERLVSTIKKILWASFVTLPDMFVFPKHWNTYKDILHNVLFESRLTEGNEPEESGHPSLEAQETSKIWERVKLRNEFFGDPKEDLSMFKKYLSSEPRAHLFRILDKMDHSMNHFEILDEYFPIKTPSFPTSEANILLRLQTLCHWAVTNYRVGNHRPYVACTLLEKWKNSEDDEQERLRRQLFLQDSLLQFLDEYNCGTSSEGYQVVAHLFGELIRCGHFSPTKYMQRLISRGDTNDSKRSEERTLRHLKYVKCLPLYNGTRYLYNQRRWILYGVGGQDKNEELTYENLLHKIMAKLPRIFGEGADKLDAPVLDDAIDDFELSLPLDHDTCDLIKNTTRFTQMRLTQMWLLPRVREFIQKAPIGEHNWRMPTQPGSTLLNARQFSTIIQVLEHAQDFYALIEISLWVLENTMERSLFPVIVDTFSRHEIMWAAMGKSMEVFRALQNKHESLREKSAIERSMAEYICHLCGITKNEIVIPGRQSTNFFIHDLTEEQKTQLNEDIGARLKISLSSAITRHKQNLGNDLLPLITRADGFRSPCPSDGPGWLHSDNPSVMLNSSIEIIHQYSKECSDYREIRRVILIFGDMLRDIYDRTKDGRIDVVFKHCIERHVIENGVLKHHNTNWFLHFLVILIVRRLLSIDVLLSEIVGSFQRLVSKILNAEELNEMDIEQATNLTLLVSMVFAQKGDYRSEYFGLCTMDIQMLQTHCAILSHPTLALLSGIMRDLVIIESTVAMTSPLIEHIQKLRKNLANALWFRRLCAAYPAKAYNYFVISSRESSFKSTEKNMVDMMLIAFGDVHGMDHHVTTRSSAVFLEYLKDMFSQINMWNIHQISVQFRLCMDSIILSKKSLILPENSTTATNLEGDIMMTESISRDDVESDEPSVELAVIKYVWEQVINQQQLDAHFIKEIIDGIRKDVAQEMLTYGMSVLSRCEPLMNGIDLIFRVLLKAVNDEEKDIKLCEALLRQVKSLYEKSEAEFQSTVMARIHLLIPLVDPLLSRVVAVKPEKIISHEMFEKIRECRLIEQWIFILVQLLTSNRIHEPDNDPANFEVLLDLVSLLLDEMGTKPRVIVASELKKANFVVPSMGEDRVRRILPLRPCQRPFGVDGKTIDPWKVTEYVGNNKVLGNDTNTLWPGAKIYRRPKSRKPRLNRKLSDSSS